MCGIAGIISEKPFLVTRERLERMTQALAHRGPDGEAHWMHPEGHLALGHRRLAIIDLSPAGGQPMHCLNRYTIVHNGEIYNYIELKEELLKKGYHFQTKTDTEVIVSAYDQFGENCLQHFDGMFAFSIWDEQEKKLFVARDRFGEKPFYYFTDKDQFIWASEMKALWAAGIERKRNDSMLLNYLALGWIQDPADPSRTFFSNIHSLSRGHSLVYHHESREIKITNYWDLDKERQEKKDSLEEWSDAFRKIFFESVDKRLRSDVPLGTSLSGGLDSSSIIAVISSLPNHPAVHHSFTCTMAGFEKDESEMAARVAKRFNLQSYTVSPVVDDFLNDFDQLLVHQEEPIGSASVFLQFKLMKLAKENGMKVLLDGQGADETLSGYSKYIHWYLQELIAKRNFKLMLREKRLFHSHHASFNWDWKNWMAAFLPAQAANRLEIKSLSKIKGNPAFQRHYVEANIERDSIFKPLVTKLNDILYFNTLSFGLEELLRYADRNSMAHGMEIRLPFLSHKLVELVFSAPSELKMKDGFGKYLLRRSMEKELPKEITWRRDKIGFEAPQEQWMQNEKMRQRVMEAKKTLVKEGLLNKIVLEENILALPAYAEDNYDWRYLVAANTMF